MIAMHKFCDSDILNVGINVFSGDITQKGYEKKRLKLITPYVAVQKAEGECKI